MTRLLALPLALAGLVILGVVEMIERRHSRREREKLDRVLGRVLEDIAEEERETLEMLPYSAPVTDGVRLNAPGGEC